MPRSMPNSSAPASPMMLPRSAYGRKVNGYHQPPSENHRTEEHRPYTSTPQRNHDFHKFDSRVSIHHAPNQPNSRDEITKDFFLPAQSHNDSISSSWTERSVSPGSVQAMSINSRPQTPAFPVHPRTPYGHPDPYHQQTPGHHSVISYVNNNVNAESNNNNHYQHHHYSNNNNHNHNHYNNNNNSYEERREVVKEIVRLPPKSPTMIR